LIPQDCSSQSACILSTSSWRQLPDRVFAYRFSFRKRAILRRFLDGVSVHFIRDAQRIPPGSSVLLWGSDPMPAEAPADVRIVRVEDGFLRSVGLGADLIRPVSWVIDQSGIYYDATQPSDLERLLRETAFEPPLLARAARLRNRIVAGGLTKYNVEHAEWAPPPHAKHVVLVTGQVESDASIRFGALSIRTNMGLLQTVRTALPEAYVMYKPHPDVLAGLRASGQDETAANQWCDEVASGISLAAILPRVDEVHVLTSLAGFEALLRSKPVTCHGMPFYAGWGLTTDMLSSARRTRRLSLDELVAGALILYPTYVSRNTGKIVAPEVAVEELLAWRAQAPESAPIWRNLFRIVLRWAVGVK
jgi:capsular polysaccharide export protein